MDIGDPDPLSARSTSSIEDGGSSTRSKKSKTLARLRKLKKTDGSPRDPSKDGLIPHPPDSQQGHASSDRRLSNGFVNGGSELHDDLTQSTKIGGDKITENMDIISGIDKPKVTSLDSLPSNRLDWGKKSPLKSSLFSSPLDPVKPARRGLGGLEPLAPRTVLEPLEKPKMKSQLKAEDKLDSIEMGRSEVMNGTFEVNEAAKEIDSTPLKKGDVLRIDGVVETETSDSQDFGSFPNRNSAQESDSLRLSNVEENISPEKLLEMQTHVHERVHTKDDVSKSRDVLVDSEDDDGDALDILPDNGDSHERRSDVLVSSAMTERTNLSRTFDDVTNTRAVSSEDNDVFLRKRLESSLVEESSDVLQEQQTKRKTTVTQIEEDNDDESDDELIVVSPLTNPIKSHTQTSIFPSKSEESQMVDDRGEREKEDELQDRMVHGRSDNEEEPVKDDSQEDEKNLKQYLQDKLQHIEDDEDSDVVITTSPSSSLRAGRLSPITNASAPPPLPNTVMSPSLRTMYKRDDDMEDSFGNSEVSDAVLSGASLSDTSRSMASSSLLLNTLTNKGARKGNRSYLSGGVRNTGSLVGKDELDSHLPERRLRIFVATWNMHEDKEIPENLDDLLLPEDIEYMQDVYVIGTQESTSDIAEWEIRLQETLGPSHVLLHSASHGVLQCAVFMRRDLIWFCSPVEESRVSTRPGSMIKTKGAIAVSFNFFGTSFIFIVSHFTSGDENMKERLLDYEKILKGISLPDKVPPTRKFNILTSDVTTRFDCVFWCGDFNFRLAENKARIEGWIDQLKRGNKDDYDILLQHDQLNRVMQRNEIFKGFQEGKIQFLPTYKFDIGEDIYDTSPKARVPSYTDRVLYKSRRVADISLIHYSSCEEIKTSDHRPVYAVFEAGVRPGKDNSLMGGGMFVRQVYIEGIKRRVAKAGMSKRTQAGSAVCSVM